MIIFSEIRFLLYTFDALYLFHLSDVVFSSSIYDSDGMYFFKRENVNAYNLLHKCVNAAARLAWNFENKIVVSSL